MNTPGGLPAFPSSQGTGITLRDYLAAKALQVTVPQYNVFSDSDIEAASQRAYLIADAMLRARNIQ